MSTHSTAFFQHQAGFSSPVLDGLSRRDATPATQNSHGRRPPPPGSDVAVADIPRPKV